MANYRLLFCCTATLSFTVALAAEPTPATKPAITAHPIEAAPKAVPAKVQKEAAAKTPAPPKEPGITFNSVHVDGPYIAMTFDDGPSATLTPKLLDLLAAHHIKATFFVIGEIVAEHPEILRELRGKVTKSRVIVGRIPISRKMSDESVRSQLQRTDDAIKNATGQASHVDAAAIWIDHRTRKTMDSR